MPSASPHKPRSKRPHPVDDADDNQSSKSSQSNKTFKKARKDGDDAHRSGIHHAHPNTPSRDGKDKHTPSGSLPERSKDTDTTPSPQNSTITKIDRSLLLAQYDVVELFIGPNSKIESKVTHLLKLLMNNFSWTATEPQKCAVVVLSSSANASNKMVSIIEITKRRLEEQGLRWWQYTVMDTKLEENFKRMNVGVKQGDSAPKTLHQWEKEKSNSEEEIQATTTQDRDEQMNIDAVGRRLEQIVEPTKSRQTPLLKTYLSRVAVAPLRQIASEQCCPAFWNHEAMVREARVYSEARGR